MAALDYNALRAQTLVSSHEEEAVTVNTRALIDKVLARYSGEHTTLRELLQNAADANATTVEIRLQSTVTGQGSAAELSLEDPRDLLKLKIRRMLVKNDGQAFREEDWQRLKRIAEGNPDETKIGAFGVGFYSVFADCEEPFVSSGDQAMAFYWKGNQLFTRRAKLPNFDKWTTFLLESREPTEIPDLKGLCKFLATSLTFVKLSSISLYIDNRCLLTLTKKSSPPMPLIIPSTLDPSTQSKVMRIAGVTTESVQIDAKYMNITQYSPASTNTTTGPTILSFFSRFASQPVVTAPPDKDLLSHSIKTIFLRIANAVVHTSVDRKSAAELERATKKPPPKVTQLSILTMSKPEHDASEKDAHIFENVVPTSAGKVFIGFPTHQTTGIKAHISAHSVIPTVERESIDLNARIVKEWNVELLKIAGILSRIMYHDEMSTIGRQAKGLNSKDIEALYDHAIHVMQQFTFTDSTPSSTVGQYIMSGFWSCSKDNTIELLSTKGVLSSQKIRLSTDISFLEGLPMLPKPLALGAPEFIKTLVDYSILIEVTMADIINQLESKALSGEQITEFLKWAAKQRLSQDMAPEALKTLLDSAVISNAESGLPITLGTIKHTVNKSKLHDDIPLPADTIPFQVTKSMTPKELEAIGWTELGVAEWLNFLCNRRSPPVAVDFSLSAEFAQLVLSILSKNWEKESQPRREYMVNCLKNRTCIPTKQGMRKPGEAYFPTVKLFADLPIIAQLSGIKEKFLLALGVRKTVELKIVFDRLMDENVADITGEKRAKWSHVDLIKYLVGVQDDIPPEDITRLKGTPICKSEVASGGLYKVSSLYEPNEQLRRLKLPILQWPGEWRPASNEAKFLLKLGLQKFPTATDLVGLMGGTDRPLAELALQYFIINYLTNEYNQQSIPMNVSFLPLDSPESKGQLVTPSGCYYNPKAAILGFAVLRKDLHPHAEKFKVQKDPDMNRAVSMLISSPPQTQKNATEQFGYFASRLSEIMPHHVHRLSSAPFVPVFADKSAISTAISHFTGDSKSHPASGKVKHLAPSACYLGSKTSLYADVFDFVDFGLEANPFLWKCGSKNEPTTIEVAYLLVREPARLLDAFGGYQKYLSVLRTLAEQYSTLKKDKQLIAAMRKSPFLLATMDLPVTEVNEKSEHGDDDQTIKEYQLANVSQIVVSDDFVAYNLFKDKVLVAPQEDLLEDFYQALGVVTFSSIISEAYTIGMPVSAVAKAQELQKLILERIRIFLHSQTESIRHDAKWIEKNVRVDMVQRIRLRRSLKLSNGQQIAKVQEVTAAITEYQGIKALYVSPQYQLFDVSQLLVNLVLFKPKLHSSLLLESLLTTDLVTLKARGYNVDRILKARAAEARLAEQARRQRDEERAKAVEAEARADSERSKLETDRNRSSVGDHKKPKEIEGPAMPGGFNTSPPRHSKSSSGGGGSSSSFIQNSPAPVSTFFNKMKGHLGFDSHKPHESLQNMLGQGHGSGSGSGSGGAGGSSTTLTPQETTAAPVDDGKNQSHKPTKPHVLRSNLHNAIAASRAHDSNKVFSPAQTQQVKEQKTYCDSKPGQDIKFLTEMPSGIRIFIDRSVDPSFLRPNITDLNAFSTILVEIGAVFDLPTSTIHIYYDETGPTIAFNLNGSLFFNFRYYRELHAGGGVRRSEALVYWFVTACHELAHNVVKDHSSDHSFYTESFVQMYFEEMMARVARAEGGGGVVGGGQAAVAAGGGGGGAVTRQLVVQPPPPYDG
ncbi:hypothetical protein DFH27DRAFT_481023 [Peziza echinospora]|nr:hypothetical protein DFH27DRAFT_481023 [Peziza echinospora]